LGNETQVEDRWKQSGRGWEQSGPKQTSTGKEVQGNRKRDRDFKTKQETLQIITPILYIINNFVLEDKTNLISSIAQSKTEPSHSALKKTISPLK